MQEPLWRPGRERVAASAIEEFRLQAAKLSRLELPDYAALHAWSVARPDEFWPLLASFARLPLTGSQASVRTAEPMPYTRWFPGVRLNYARALLYPAGLDDPERAALIAETEDGSESKLSYRELRELVADIQRSLLDLGVGKGDVVAAFAANLPESVALLLACAGIGAVYSSCSPDFGATAAAARFSQLDVKALFVTTGYRYAGRWYDTSDTAARLRSLLMADGADLPTVALPYPDAGGTRRSLPAGARSWADFLASGAAADASADAADGAADGAAEGDGPLLEELPFDHPLYVLFSSGTTGPPKAMVHRAGGVLLTHVKEHLLHSDTRPGDKVFYFTTCGWMMWNWLVSALACAATVVLYDGSPAEPDLQRPFALAARHDVTFLGLSARYLHTLKAEGAKPRERFSLGSLKTLASTGSPLSPSGFEYVYESVKPDVHLASISGGTDIVGCFMLGVPILPVYAGQLQAAGLGVDLAVLDEDGSVLLDEPGELVCRQPLPSMPLRFIADEGFERYKASYFSTYPGYWRHGDLVEHDSATGGYVVHGRSDATLNPSGVRIGTAEIYRALEAVPEVLEAAAVGRRQGEDEVIWLLLVLSEGVRLDDVLRARVRGAIRTGASPRHLPSEILAVNSLPRTRSGKAMELAVAHLVNGREVPNADVIANPEALDDVRVALAALTAPGG